MVRFWLVAFVCLMLVVSVGCGRKETPPPTVPPASSGIAPPIQPSAVDFDKVTAAIPTGSFSKAINKELQPVFATVFGGAKLSDAFEMGGDMGGSMGQGKIGGHLVYALKRRIVAADEAKLKKEFSVKGYKYVQEEANGQLKTISFEKKAKASVCTLTLGVTIDDQKIGVAAFEQK